MRGWGCCGAAWAGGGKRIVIAITAVAVGIAVTAAAMGATPSAAGVLRRTRMPPA